LAFLLWQAGLLENNDMKSVNGRRAMAELLPFLSIDRDLPDIVVEDDDGKYVELTDRIQYRFEARDNDDQ